MNLKVTVYILILFAFLFGDKANAQRPSLFGTVDMPDRPFKIALIIPFCTKYTKQELVKMKLLSLHETALQYYQGISIALDSLKSLGLKLEVNVYETNKDSLTTLRIFNKPEMKDMDLIVGPFYKQGVDMAVKFCTQYQVYHIAPAVNVVSQTVDPYLIIPNSEVLQHEAEILNYILKTDSGSTICLLTDNKKSSQRFMQKMGLLADSLGIKIKKIDATKDFNWSGIISEDRKVSIVFPSNNDALLQKLYKSISDTGGGVTIYGVESWLTFKNNNFDLWEKFHVTIFTGNYVDYNDEGVKRFVAKYQRTFYTDPAAYSFKAFDQLMSVSVIWLSNPLGWKLRPEQWGNGDGLSSNIEYMRDEQSQNLVNKNFKILRFTDYELKWVW